MFNAINWVELPSVDFERAVRFYETILDTKLRQEIFNGEPNAMFPTEGDDPAGGAIISRSWQKPSADGALVYLNAAGKMSTILNRIEAAGGKVLMPRTSIGDPGFISIFIDSEGNKVALHEPA
jgi:predicted enzyme related to lactoylglutathione lyase